MTMPERRKSQRSSGFFIVNFRNLKSIKQHSPGVTANISHEGLGLESQNANYTPGEILEIILKDPHSELSVSAEGEVVWRRDGWYKCEMGIKLRQETVEKNSDIFGVLSNGDKMPAESLSPEENNSRPETGNNDGKNDPIVPERPDRSKVKTAKIDEAIYLGSTNAKMSKKSSGENPKPPLRKGSGAYSQGIVLKEMFMSTPRKKNRTLAVFLTVLSVVLLAAAASKFNDIKKALPLNTQPEQFVFSQDPDERRDLSFPVGDQPNGPGTREPEVPLRVSNDRHIDHASLPGEAKTDVRQSISVSEGILQVNDLRVTVTFDYNSDIIDPNFYPKIENIVSALLSRPESIVTIEGHTDDSGPEMYNMDLSMRRSMEVKKMLIRKGIESERIKVAFMGESKPLSPNLTESGRMRNRRVEMIVVSAAD